jgi:hypothetical protein
MSVAVIPAFPQRGQNVNDLPGKTIACLRAIFSAIFGTPYAADTVSTARQTVILTPSQSQDSLSGSKQEQTREVGLLLHLPSLSKVTVQHLFCTKLPLTLLLPHAA